MTFRAGISRHPQAGDMAEPRGIRMLDYARSDASATPKRTQCVRAGYAFYRRADLERIWAEGRRLRLTVAGVLRLPDDLPPQLADDVFEQVTCLGPLLAPPAVVERLRDNGKLVHSLWAGVVVIPLAVAQVGLVVRIARGLVRRLQGKRSAERSRIRPQRGR